MFSPPVTITSHAHGLLKEWEMVQQTGPKMSTTVLTHIRMQTSMDSPPSTGLTFLPVRLHTLTIVSSTKATSSHNGLKHSHLPRFGPLDQLTSTILLKAKLEPATFWLPCPPSQNGKKKSRISSLTSIARAQESSQSSSMSVESLGS